MYNSNIRFISTEKMLRELGIGRNLVAFTQISACLEIIASNPARMTNICDDVYTPAADLIGCPVGNVERNIRNAITASWKRDKNRFSKLAGYEVAIKPSVSEFLDMTFAYAQEHDGQAIYEHKVYGKTLSSYERLLQAQQAV